ncbi:hypothetical protein FACS1894151_09150 [Spirochaetia bacterium]|nr:hypothetical protein FACS1894151_09150 [Spirochaetia bacterium]
MYFGTGSIENIYGIDIFASGINAMITISDTKMEVESDWPVQTKEEYNVSRETINNINFMQFYYNGSFKTLG